MGYKDQQMIFLCLHILTGVHISHQEDLPSLLSYLLWKSMIHLIKRETEWVWEGAGRLTGRVWCQRQNWPRSRNWWKQKIYSVPGFGAISKLPQWNWKELREEIGHGPATQHKVQRFDVFSESRRIVRTNHCSY